MLEREREREIGRGRKSVLGAIKVQSLNAVENGHLDEPFTILIIILIIIVVILILSLIGCLSFFVFLRSLIFVVALNADP